MANNPNNPNNYMKTLYRVYKQSSIIGLPPLIYLGTVTVEPFDDALEAAKEKYPQCASPVVEIADEGQRYYQMRRLERMCGVPASK